jgi:predicted outer membrane lipoprotein
MHLEILGSPLSSAFRILDPFRNFPMSIGELLSCAYEVGGDIWRNGLIIV